MSARRIAAMLVGALVLALGAAPSAHAKAMVKCTGTTVAVTIKFPLDDPLTTTVQATNATTVVVNAGTSDASTETCANPITAISIEGTDDGDEVTYTGSLSFTVTADLKGGGDLFTANGTQPVNVSGGAAADTLTGGGGADTLRGGDGDDILQGRLGSDSLQGEGGSNTVSYHERTAAQGIDASLVDDTGKEIIPSLELDTFTGISHIIGGAGDDLIEGDNGGNVLFGSGGDDTITGLGGGDFLLPGTGDDSADGGTSAGDIDTIDYVDINDLPATGTTVTVTLGAPGSATVRTQNSGTGTQTLENFENVIGSPGDDVVTGDTNDNAIDGGAGTDTVSYADRTAGHDIVASLTSNEGGEAGVDTDTYASIENLTGGAGDDTLIGKDVESNVLDGGAGDDTVSYEYLPAAASVKARLGGTGGNVAHPTELDSYPNVENLRGGAGDDILIGDANDNTLDGGPGGDDTASYEGRTANLRVSLLDGGGDPLLSEDDTFVAIDNLTGGSGHDTLIGDTEDNHLDGGAGTDTVSYEDRADTHPIVASLQTNTGGEAGVDSDTYASIENLRGGDDDDKLMGRNGVTNVLNGGDGVDTVSYEQVPAGVDVKARLGGTGGNIAIPAELDSYPNVENLRGGAGDDILIGDTSNNTLDGGPAGEDTASYEGRTANLRVSLIDGGGDPLLSEDDTFVAIDHLTGGSGHDTLIGDTDDNHLDGGAGTDTVSYEDRTAAHPIEASLETNSGGEDGVDDDTYASIENLTGGAGDDTLSGKDVQNNVLDGGAGVDTASYEDIDAGVTAALGATGGKTGTAEADTYPNIENLRGGDGDDVLTGDGNANRLEGGLGDDTLNGLGGADLLVPGAGDDTLNGGADSDTVTFAGLATVPAPATSLTVDLAAGEATTPGGADYTLTGVENVIGTAGDDVLIGNTENNRLDGGSGGSDTVSYADRAAGAGVTASLTSDTGGATGGTEADTYVAIDNLTGGAGDDVLTGDELPNTLRGLGGDDDLFGLLGDDRLLPGTGGGTNDGGGGSGDVVSYEDLTATVGVTVNLTTMTATVLGETQALVSVESVVSGPGDDTLIGTTGDNVLNGGLGSDTVSYEGRPDAISASLATNSGGNAPEKDTYESIENLTGGDAGDTLIGDNGPNVLRGLGGDDHLGGNGGADLLEPGLGGGSVTGGAGTDTLSYAGVTEDLTVDLDDSPGSATSTSINQTLAEIENVTGGSGSDTLIGTTHNNVLDGGAAGVDTVSYDDRAAAVVASLAAGTGGAAGEQDQYLRIDNLTGGNGSDTLTGDDEDNVLDGGSGGSDTVSYADRVAGEDIVASLDTLTGGDPDLPETDTFVAIDNLTGGAGEDTFVGDSADNTLTGGAGDDTLRGRIGDDTLLGEAGDDLLQPFVGADEITGGTHGTAGGAHGDTGDIVSWADYPNVVTASIQGGTASVDVDTQTLAEVEGLTGGGGDDTLTGSSGADVLSGGPGDDELHPLGGGGSNSGGAHILGDTLSYSDLVAPAFANANLATGTGTVGAGVHTIAGIEHLRGGGGDDILTGDANPNDLVGAAGNDTVSGGGGNDDVRGEGGNDVLAGDAGDDAVAGASGNDVLAGGDGADALQGAAGTDTLTGGAGADLMDGGTELDRASYAANGAAEGVTVTLDGNANDGTGGGAEGDEVIGIENVSGGEGADRLVGSQGVNDLLGNGGDDVVVGGGGNDTLRGNGGSDTLSYEDRGAGEAVTVTLNLPASGGATGESDNTEGFERLLGGAGNDLLTGSALGDVIVGAGGADVVSGADGNDSLFGSAGDDTLAGGTGTDGLSGEAGNDRLDGGADADGYDGGDGNDDLNAFDGLAETVVCGAGDDRADHDLTDGFPLADCESRVLLGYVPPPFPLDPRPRDRDRDGAFAGPDCNDLDPTIGPAAPDVPGNDIDENCDTVDAPFPAVGTEFRLRFGKGPRGTRIQLFELRKVPANATIEIRCTSRRAPRCVFSKRTRTIGARRAKVSVRGYFGDRSLSQGSKVEARILAPRTIGRVMSFTMRKPGVTPKLIYTCLPPGATKPIACP